MAIRGLSGLRGERVTLLAGINGLDEKREIWLFSSYIWGQGGLCLEPRVSTRVLLTVSMHKCIDHVGCSNPMKIVILRIE